MKRLFLNLFVAAATAFSFTCCGGGGGGNSEDRYTMTLEQFTKGQRVVSLYSGGVEARFEIDESAPNPGLLTGTLVFGGTSDVYAYTINIRNVETKVEENDEGKKSEVVVSASMFLSPKELDLTDSKISPFFLIPYDCVYATLGSNNAEFVINFADGIFTMQVAEDAEYVVRKTDEGEATVSKKLSELAAEIQGVVVVRPKDSAL